MPTVTELAEYIKSKINLIPGDYEVYKSLVDDPENLLSYLYQPMPWKKDEESLIDKAAFINITTMITNYIKECEELSIKNGIPEWSFRFVEYLHRNSLTIATLNYDTLIERISRPLMVLDENEERDIDTSNFYRMPLMKISGRTNFLWGIEWYETYLLLRLHGSINWYFYGDEALNGQQVYDVPVESDSPITDIQNETSNLIDLVPLIIPPVSEKTAFYRTKLVRSLWSVFRESIEKAKEIYMIGYSIPKTDLTMRMFLSSFGCKNKPVIYIVNNATGKASEELLNNYRGVFSGCTIDTKYLGIPNAVEVMVNDLLTF